MKKTIEFAIPDGYILDKKHSTDEKLVYVKENSRPTSLEEFYKNHKVTQGEAFIDTYSVIRQIEAGLSRDMCSDKNLCTSVEEAEAFLALIQLRQLRKAWIGDWIPKYDSAGYTFKHTVKDTIEITAFISYPGVLSFPTLDMINEFYKCFKDLFEKAKILL